MKRGTSMDGISEVMVFVVSDSVGETAEMVIRAAASQFNGNNVIIEREAFVNSEERIADVISKAKRAGAIVAFTLVEPELRVAIKKEAYKQDIVLVDILGPMLDALVDSMDSSPKLQPGLIRKINDDYYRRVEAVEFAVKYDDGKDPRGLLHADLVLLGVSRTSKTPLSMYMANRRLKVANVPLVPEVPPLDELFSIPREKIIGLTIAHDQLERIRKERIRSIGLTTPSDYASMERILQEIDYAEGIMRRLGCPIIDVTGKAVEEVSALILQIITRRKQHNE